MDTGRSGCRGRVMLGRARTRRVVVLCGGKVARFLLRLIEGVK